MKVEDKLREYSNKIYEYINQETMRKYEEFIIKSKDEYDHEIEKTEEKTRRMIEEAKTKAENDKRQMLYRMKVEQERVVLIKKYNLHEKFVSEVFEYAKEFVMRPEYENILIKCIKSAISEMKDKKGAIYITGNDINRFNEKITVYVKAEFPGSLFDVQVTEQDIIGGCLIVDKIESMRLDYTIKTLIEDGMEIIGILLNEYLNDVSVSG